MLLVDVAAVLVFCAIGRRSHDEGLSVTSIAETAWPFLTGTAVGWLLARGWQRPTALVPTGVVVWVCTVAVGMALRRSGVAGADHGVSASEHHLGLWSTSRPSGATGSGLRAA